MEKLHVFSKLLFSAALCYIATAIILFTLELGKTRESIPALLKQVEKVEASAEIPKILAQVAGITQEIAAVRTEIPAILEQVKKTREMVPAVLQEVGQLRSVTVPAVLKEVQLAQQATIPAVLKQVREAMPSVLQEVAAVRKEAPEILTKTQKIMDDAKRISSQATSGAVQGVFKGVLSAPLNLIKEGVDKTIDGAKDLTGNKQ